MQNRCRENYAVFVVTAGERGAEFKYLRVLYVVKKKETCYAPCLSFCQSVTRNNWLNRFARIFTKFGTDVCKNFHEIRYISFFKKKISSTSDFREIR